MMAYANPKYRVIPCMLSYLFIFFATEKVNAQASQTVSEIVTNYNTYFKSSTIVINAIKPNNSHDLLAFMYGGTRFSTGVDDAALTSNGDAFTGAIFKSFSITGIPGTITSNTKLGLGQLYDGVNNGASAPAPVNNLPLYLTDGVNGLNLGTGVANLPNSDLYFSISNLNPLAIGDGIPDILITQIADPSAGVDNYEFTDASNVVVGTAQNISFSGINVVANWTADFYEANTNPATLTAGFANTDRPLRLWAADFSYFGITTTNYTTVKNFIIHLNGSSDMAFVAYNTASSFIVLPVGLTSFTSSVSGKDIQLSWQTETENNSSYFEIEHSNDGMHFNKLGTVNAAGNSSTVNSYSFKDHNVESGAHYYRLKQHDIDGKYTYSKIIRQGVFIDKTKISVYPNPAINDVTVTHPGSADGDILSLYSSSGELLFTKKLTAREKRTNINISSYSKGGYIFQLNSAKKETSSARFLIK
jgi:hypothetical protein